MRTYRFTLERRVRCPSCDRAYKSRDGSDCPYCAGRKSGKRGRKK